MRSTRRSAIKTGILELLDAPMSDGGHEWAFHDSALLALSRNVRFSLDENSSLKSVIPSEGLLYAYGSHLS
jgi:hypothetical protein